MTGCAVARCMRPAVARGMCTTHYQADRRVRLNPKEIPLAGVRGLPEGTYTAEQAEWWCRRHLAVATDRCVSDHGGEVDAIYLLTASGDGTGQP